MKRLNLLLGLLLGPAILLYGATPPVLQLPVVVTGVQTYSYTTPTLYNFAVSSVSSPGVFLPGVTYGGWCTFPSGIVPGGGANPNGTITPPEDPGNPTGMASYDPINSYSVTNPSNDDGFPGFTYNAATQSFTTTSLTLSQEWNAVNWILNNPNGVSGETATTSDIQAAIWQLLHPDLQFGFVTTTSTPGSALTPASAALYNDALANGLSFVPTTGVVGVLMVPTNLSYQGFIIPVPVASGIIGDYVFSDTNGNGIQSANDPGINGVMVQLYQGTTLVATTTTTNAPAGYPYPGPNPAGYYQFTGLPNGTYTVVIPSGQPGLNATSGPSPAFQGTNPLIDSNGQPGTVPGTTTPAVTATVTLPNNNQSPNSVVDESIDLGFLPKTTPAGTIGDYVFLDMNGTGIQSANDPGINGVTVQLYQGNTLVATTTTANAPAGYPYPGPNPAGYYQFTNLPNGTYTVVIPSGQSALSATSGPASAFQGTNILIDSNGQSGNVPGTTTPAVIATITLPNNNLGPNSVIDETIDMGFLPKSTAIGTIGDYVFQDNNGTGIQSPNDPGINGVTVQLYQGNTLVATTTTTNAPAGYPYSGPNPAGYYQFTGLPNGTYTVVIPGGQSALSGTSGPAPAFQGTNPLIDSNGQTGNVPGSTTPAVVATVTLPNNDQGLNSTTDESIDLGFLPKPATTGVIGDYVFLDNNRTGIQSANDTGINGVTVQLYQGTTLVATTTTANAPAGYPNPGPNPAGYYQFTGLPSGSYTVVIPSNQAALSGTTGPSPAFQGSNTSVDSNGQPGVIPGTSTAAVTAAVTLASNSSIDETIDLGFLPPLPPAPMITCSPNNGGQIGSPFNVQPPTVTGGTPPYTFLVVNGTLPTGLMLNSSTGAITGTPSTFGTFYLQVKDANGFAAVTTCPYTVGSVPTACTNLPYPYGSAPALSSVVFNESGVLEDWAAAGSGNTLQLRAWFNDEHAPLLGARSAGGVSFPFTAYSGTPEGVYNPNGPIPVGSTVLTGPTAGVDTALQSSAYNFGAGYPMSGRPLWPAVFLTDLTVNGVNSMAGDWQQGGTSAIPPNGVFGTWKGAVVTGAGSSMVVTTDADPTANGIIGVRDPLPGGVANGQQYTTEAVWNVMTFPGVIPGHTYRAQVIVHDGDQNHSGGDVGEACLTGITIAIAPLTLSGPGNGFVGTPFSSSLTAAGGVAPYTYSISSLPPGLTLNPTTGAITGIPTTSGGYPATIKVTDGSGNVVTNQSTITIGAEQMLNVSSCPTNTGNSGSPFSAIAPTVTGGYAPYTFTVVGTLPVGLKLNASTGAITGTPTAIGSFSTKVGDTQGNSATGCSYSIKYPCLLGNLGSAGSFSILGISGGNQNNPQINIQGSFGGSATIGVGANVQLHVQGNTNLTNAVTEDPSAKIQLDGGASISGTQTQEPFAAIQSAAIAASSAAAALTTTQTISQSGNNSITVTGNGGQNVISVTNQINLNNGQNLVIHGGPNDTFIFNFQQGQNLQLQNGSSIVLQGGVSPSQVLFNFLGNGGNVQIQSNNNGASNTAGIFLNINGQINIQGGTHNSVFISGNQIQIQNNPSPTINGVPCP